MYAFIRTLPEVAPKENAGPVRQTIVFSKVLLIDFAGALFLLALSSGCGIIQQFKPHEKKAAQILVEMGASIGLNREGEVDVVSFHKGGGRLTFSKTITVTDDALKHLSSFGSLRKLDLPHNISNEGLAHIADLTKLEELWLNGEMFKPSEAGRISSAGMVHLKDLVNLQYLSFPPGCQLEDNHHLAYLRKLKKLKMISYSFHGQITDEGLEHLSALESLEGLTLNNSKITDHGLVHVEKMKRLEDLLIHHTRVTPAAVARLEAALPECDVGGQIRPPADR
jgi:hypothetical protein